MKRFIGLVLALAGAGLLGWAGYCWLGTGGTVHGYHPMYPGLVGIALLAAGLIARQD